MRTHRLIALAVVASLGASCASTDDQPASSDAPMTTSAAPTTVADAPATTVPATDPATTGVPSTDAPTTTATATDAPTTTTAPAPPTTVDVLPESEAPVVPVPLPLSGTPAENAVAVADAVASPDADHSAAVLAAFDAAGLPVLLADGRSVTSTPDPVGFTWPIVASAAEMAHPDARVSLTELVRLFRFADPAGEFDVDAASADLLAGLRTALVTPDPAGPSFLAHLVAEDARRFDGTEMADPAVTADGVHVSTTTSMVITASALRGAWAGMVAAGAITFPTSSSTGFAPPPPPPPAQAVPLPFDPKTGCDDGYGSWLLWFGSKVATGFELMPVAGLEWQGMYARLVELGVARGLLVEEALEVPKTMGKGAAVGGALVNVLLFMAQISQREATATMDGEGPLVRTKKRDEDGAARMVTLKIRYEVGDEKLVKKRNCMLAALGFAGNNAQQAMGDAVDVIVGTQGAHGFTTNLAANDSIVMFGPSTFHIEQTTDKDGKITVPVQGRRQKQDKTDADRAVFKEFSIFFEATFDPTTASTIAQAFADDALCLGSIMGGKAVEAVAECQNALIDIMKQFRWDIGEFEFPLQDWENGGWEVVGGVIDPYSFTGIKCDGIGGLWFLNVIGQFEGAVFDGVFDGQMDAETGTGDFIISGIAEASGVSIPVDGVGTMTFVQTGEDMAELVIEAQIAGAPGPGGGTLELVRTSCE